MPNRNYINGRAFEYRRMKAWRKKGATVMRTAGSHGPFDLIALWPTNVFLIQCKRVHTVAQADRLLEEFRDHPPLGKHSRRPHCQVMEVYVSDLREIMETRV